MRQFRVALASLSFVILFAPRARPQEAKPAEESSSQQIVATPKPPEHAGKAISWHRSAILMAWGGGNTGVRYPETGAIAIQEYRRGRLGAELDLSWLPRGKVNTSGKYYTLKALTLGRFYVRDTWFLEGGMQANRSSFQSDTDPNDHYIKAPIYPVVGFGRQWNQGAGGGPGPNFFLKFDWFLQENRTQNKVQAWRLWSRSDLYPWAGRRVGTRVDVYFQYARSNDDPTHRGNIFEIAGGFGLVFRHCPTKQACPTQ